MTEAAFSVLALDSRRPLAGVLEAYADRTAIREYVGGEDRRTAEREAYSEVADRALRQRDAALAQARTRAR